MTIKSLTSSFVRRHRGSGLLERLACICRRYLRVHDGVSYDIHSNGEYRLLQALAAASLQRPLRSMFDVGASTGEWALAAAGLFPHTTIHCFEVARPTFVQLVRQTRDCQTILTQDVGLADYVGDVSVRYFPDTPEVTTLTDFPQSNVCQVVTGQVTTGDLVAAQLSLDRIGFVKIDVEGYEHKVLKGFSNMLSRSAIDVVQFEYGYVNVVTHFLLRDFHALFAAYGYQIGIVRHTHVEFRDYNFSHEDFRGPNFIAVRQDRVDLIHALERR